MYTVRFWNDIEKTNSEFIVFSCDRFTKKQYDIVLCGLFYLACQGCENDSLIADVFKGEVNLNDIKDDERGLFSIYSKTVVDGSTIDLLVYNNSEFYRKMNIAN